MDYHFIEYRANEMIPGDWEWYLDSYSADPETGRRIWVKNDMFTVYAYEFPDELKHHVLTAAAFMPMNAKYYSSKTLPAPEGVRWGSVTCIRKDFADLLDTALLENAVIGELRTRDGKIITGWLPIQINNTISIPIGKSDGPIATAKHFTGKRIYDSDKYSMILPDDLYQVVRGFRFKGCRITSCAVPD